MPSTVSCIEPSGPRSAFPGANMAIRVVPVMARSARYMLATLPMTYMVWMNALASW